jgi:hypothetical protein
MEAHITQTPETAAERQRWPDRQEPRGGGALLIVGVILGFLGLCLLVGGGRGFMAMQDRDADGYYNSDTEVLTTDLYALSSPPEFTGAGPDVLYARDLLGSVRITGENTSPETPLFIGIGSADDVGAYLDGVGHDEVRDLDVSPFVVEYDSHPGDAPAEPPTEQTFWATSVSGTGPQTLQTEIPAGDWSVVIMNADGSGGVSADLQAGATLPIVSGITIGALAVGALLLAIGIVLTVLGLRRRA